MIINTDFEATMNLLRESYANLLEDIDQESEKLKKDKDPDLMNTLGSRAHDKIRYWFEHYGELKVRRH